MLKGIKEISERILEIFENGESVNEDLIWGFIFGISDKYYSNAGEKFPEEYFDLKYFLEKEHGFDLNGKELAAFQRGMIFASICMYSCLQRKLETEKYGLLLGKAERKVLKLIMETPGISFKEIKNRMSIRRNTLDKMEKENLIAAVKSFRESYYFIMEKGEFIMKK